MAAVKTVHARHRVVLDPESTRLFLTCMRNRQFDLWDVLDMANLNTVFLLGNKVALLKEKLIISIYGKTWGWGSDLLAGFLHHMKQVV